MATWPAGAVGSYTVTANVDDVNRITESNESNNTLAQSFSITNSNSPPPTPPPTTPPPTPTPTPPTPTKKGDLNNDNKVDIFDLSILLSRYGSTNAQADLIIVAM